LSYREAEISLRSGWAALSFSLSFYLILFLANFNQVLNEILKFITVKNGLTPFSFLTILLKISSLERAFVFF